MAIKKKTVKVAPKKEVVETKVEAKVEAPKQEIKEWTYDELIALPREEFLKVEADVKA